MDKLLTIKELSQKLNISRSKAYSLTKDITFPVIRIGKCIRISENALNLWLQNKTSML